MKQKMNLRENWDKNPLMSNAHTINHQPDKFIIDFRCAFPQFSQNGQAELVVTHKLVLMDAFLAKVFLSNLSNNIKRYEEKFGKITKPDSYNKAEKLEAETNKSTSHSEKPIYMG